MCPSRPSGSDTVERKEVQDKISGEEAAEELVETKKVVEDLEREDTRLNGIVIQEQAEIQNSLESVVR